MKKSNIINICDMIKPKEDPYSSGIAICLFCKHEWVAVSPVGTKWLECPECNTEKGVYKYPYLIGDKHWTCNCGNDLFHANIVGIYCPMCGDYQEEYNVD